MKPPSELHGVTASFASPEAFIHALQKLRSSGWEHLEANVPFAVDGMDELLPGKPTPVAPIVLAAGVAGAIGGYFLQWYAARDYALNAGGRPVHSWPAFVPVTFELSVLAAAVTGVAALLWLTRLPRLDYPLFAVPEFARATQDRLFLGVRADDPRFDLRRVRELLESLDPESLTEVHT